MQKTKYNIAIQTYMEVFDFLITNNLFVFDSEKDFLNSRIKIGKYGFVLETQIARNTWDEDNPNKKLIPAIYVLNVLTNNIDNILRTTNVPASPSNNYAYINDTKSILSGKRTYYQSYQELLEILKQIQQSQEEYYYSNGKIINFYQMKYRELAILLSKLTPLEIRTIECYARLEEELIKYTSNLIMIDEDGYPLEEIKKELYLRKDPAYPLHSSNKNRYVDWYEFKQCITEIYEYQLEENKFDMQGIYNPWDYNPYKSELGLDGKTK